MIDTAALAAAWVAGLAGACVLALALARLWEFAKRLVR